MRHGSLFSGIGGFDLAAQQMGWENVFQVEIDPWCRKVLKKNFPNTKQYGDIKEFKGEPGSVDILSGGFPCQPFSTAGKRKGESDDRYLWPEYLRVIREIQPSYVVGENVAGLLSMENGKTLEGIFTDLEGEGYTVESFIIPACGVGAWHRRDRIWIVAYTNNIRHADGLDPRRNKAETSRGERENKQWNGVQDRERVRAELYTGNKDVNSNSNSGRLQGSGPSMGQMQSEAFKDWEADRFLDTIQREARPYHNRDNYGVSKKLDEARIKGLGNAIVPQVAVEIFKAIEQINLES